MESIVLGVCPYPWADAFGSHPCVPSPSPVAASYSISSQHWRRVAGHQHYQLHARHEEPHDEAQDTVPPRSGFRVGSCASGPVPLRLLMGFLIAAAPTETVCFSARETHPVCAAWGCFWDWSLVLNWVLSAAVVSVRTKE